jgi:uncharacterized protein with HEPN domain
MLRFLGPRLSVCGAILVHRYFNIDVEIVWSVVERDLPELKRQIEAILNAGDCWGK